MESSNYSELLKEAEESLDYWVDIPVMDFTQDLVRLMDSLEVTRAELARRIQSSRAYITKVLGGNANFTLATMAKLARALGSVVHVHIAPREAITQWRDVFDTADEEKPLLTQDPIADAGPPPEMRFFVQLKEDKVSDQAPIRFPAGKRPDLVENRPVSRPSTVEALSL